MPCALRRVADRCEDFGTRLLHFIMKSTYSNVYLFTKVLIYIEAYLGRCFGSNSIKRCLQQTYLFFPHTEEGAFVSDGRLAERRRVKGILNKGAASRFTPPPFFVPTGCGTQRLASLTKMPPALFGVQDTLLCRALLKRHLV